MKATLTQPTECDKQKDVSFFGPSATAQMRLIVEQSNKYVQVKNQLTTLAEQNPELRAVLDTFLPVDSKEALLEDKEAEYLARKHGWQSDRGEIWRELPIPNSEGQTAEYANDWLEAAELVRESKQYYLVRVVGDVEPEIQSGPYSKYDAVVAYARKIRADEGDDDSLYCMTVDYRGGHEIMLIGEVELTDED
jgi:hypothetical protein